MAIGIFHCWTCNTYLLDKEQTDMFFCCKKCADSHENKVQTFISSVENDIRTLETKVLAQEKARNKSLNAPEKVSPKMLEKIKKRKNKKKVAKRVHQLGEAVKKVRIYVCSGCGELGHNLRTCKSRK